MTKTLDDYMNDPALATEPTGLREIHAVRLMIHDETKDMTMEERTAYYGGSADRVFAPQGKPLRHDLVGKGKLGHSGKNP